MLLGVQAFGIATAISATAVGSLITGLGYALGVNSVSIPLHVHTYIDLGGSPSMRIRYKTFPI